MKDPSVVKTQLSPCYHFDGYQKWSTIVPKHHLGDGVI